MGVNFSNTNFVWASVLVETLHRLGLHTAVICPGSRSAPLAVAFAQHPDIEAIPVLDERSAAFFALGRAKQTGVPTALICTSGTAGANFYPAVIEARESRVPLLVLTADRPPELRDCNAGQAIDQQKLYGDYPNWYSELAIPALDDSLLAYLRQTLVYAWERSLDPVPGCVHLNIPLREPLAPVVQPEVSAWAAQVNWNQFFASVRPYPGSSANPGWGGLPPVPFSLPLEWFQPHRGILIAGVSHPRSPQAYCEAIACLSQTLGLPVLAEGLSPVRNYASLNPYLVSTYGFILRDETLADKLAPDWVIRVGEMPTNKELRQWLHRVQPQQWVIDPGDRNLDPLHGATTHLRASVEQIAAWLSHQVSAPEISPDISDPDPDYLKLWCSVEAKVRRSLDRKMQQADHWFEGKVAWLLSQELPAGTALFIANSTPVRDVEWFWQPNNQAIRPFCNRGANGIDGTLSTALGVAHRQQPTVLLTGDLSLLHDTNGFLLRPRVQGSITIVLINNNGGGIFGLLPIAQYDEVPFEELFATPQSVDFAQLCAAYSIAYERMQSWEHLKQRLNDLSHQGIRVLEVCCDRRADAQWRRSLTGAALLAAE